MPGGKQKKCTWSGCNRPDESSQFYQIEEGKTSGGQDWSSLAGSVLCKACYSRFRDRGTLERDRSKPLTGSARRCTNSGCDSPTDSSQFLQIEEGKTTGGQDWSSLAGSVLCHACYSRFRDRGALERAQNKPLVGSARRCTSDHCDSPTDSKNFYQIEEGKTTGGQDWSSVVGSLLCEACYNRFRKRGTLERNKNKPLTGSARRCTSDHCDSPTDSSKFYQIEEGKTTGGQDWSSVAGSVLCHACYDRFRRRGTLEPSAARARKKQKTANKKPSTPSSSTPPKTSSTTHDEEGKEDEDEEEDEEAPDTGECMVCLGDSRSMCIVPCGHFGLCPSCGDEDVFAGKKRPYSECPICREEMCEPYVMERWVWEELGGTSYEM